MTARSRSRPRVAAVDQPRAEVTNPTPVANVAAATQPVTTSATVTDAFLVTSALASASISMEMWAFAKTTRCELIEQLHMQTEQLKKGDMTQVEEMLYCQAVTLQAVFTKTLQHAMSSPSFKHQSAVLALAFKAQAQCRATLETLVNIKFPSAATFVKQANIANNLLVNNGAGEFSESTARACAREKTLPIEQNKLLTETKATHGRSMDTGTTHAASRSDSPLETVGVVHRPRIARRKNSLIS